MKIKREYILIIFAALIASISSVTLAYFTTKVLGEAGGQSGVSTGTFEISISDDEVNVDSLAPIYDEYYNLQAYKKTFTVSNTENSTLDAKVNLYLTLNSIDLPLQSEYFKYKLVSGGVVYGEGNFKNVETDLKISSSDILLKANQSKDFILYLWVSYQENIDQGSMLGTSMDATLKAVGEDYRNLPTIYEKILADNPIIQTVSNDTFYGVADEISESGLFRTTDLTRTDDTNGDGIGEEVLYFRGVVENNYLVFAGYCWRIVRTNESGKSIRLRYGGDYDSINNICPQTGTQVGITANGKNKFSYGYNALNNDAKYVKWVHEEGMDSNAKSIVETWYTQNIETQGDKVTSLIIDEPFCNDTTICDVIQDGSIIIYCASGRENNPQYKCPQEIDKYSVSKGNMSKPIALLTTDEVFYAGGNSTTNRQYYLYINRTYWLMSPYRLNNNYAYVDVIDFAGEKRAYSTAVENSILPVISLSNTSKVEYSGTGEYNNPYIVVTN